MSCLATFTNLFMPKEETLRQPDRFKYCKFSRSYCEEMYLLKIIIRRLNINFFFEFIKNNLLKKRLTRDPNQLETNNLIN